jgi:predicted ArsR family transcriptional regulator
MGRKKRVSDEDLLVAIATSPDPIVTAPELSNRVDYTEDGVRRRLDELESKGYVESRDVGARATIYWITPDGRRALSVDDY